MDLFDICLDLDSASLGTKNVASYDEEREMPRNASIQDQKSCPVSDWLKRKHVWDLQLKYCKMDTVLSQMKLHVKKLKECLLSCQHQ